MRVSPNMWLPSVPQAVINFTTDNVRITPRKDPYPIVRFDPALVRNAVGFLDSVACLHLRHTIDAVTPHVGGSDGDPIGEAARLVMYEFFKEINKVIEAEYKQRFGFSDEHKIFINASFEAGRQNNSRPHIDNENTLKTGLSDIRCVQHMPTKGFINSGQFVFWRLFECGHSLEEMINLGQNQGFDIGGLLIKEGLDFFQPPNQDPCEYPGYLFVNFEIAHEVKGLEFNPEANEHERNIGTFTARACEFNGSIPEHVRNNRVFLKYFGLENTLEGNMESNKRGYLMGDPTSK